MVTATDMNKVYNQTWNWNFDFDFYGLWTSSMDWG